MGNAGNLIINWLIKNSAVSEENRELNEYAVYSAELLISTIIICASMIA